MMPLALLGFKLIITIVIIALCVLLISESLPSPSSKQVSESQTVADVPCQCRTVKLSLSFNNKTS